jgi:integrase
MAKKEKYKSGQFALTRAQTDKLLNVIDVLQHEVLIRLAIAIGARRSDIVRITQDNIKQENNSVTFYEEKKHVWRTVNVSEQLMSKLKQIKDLYRSEPYLFPGNSHTKYSPKIRGKGHLSSRQAYNILRKYTIRAGIEDIPFHALRATCVKLALAGGWTYEQVADLTGDKIETLQYHYSVPSKGEMKDLVNARPIL